MLLITHWQMREALQAEHPEFQQKVADLYAGADSLGREQIEQFFEIGGLQIVDAAALRLGWPVPPE